MKLLIDTNILLDVLQKRDNYCGMSSLVWKLCETGRVEGVVFALSFANLVYVMRKSLDPGQIGSVLEMLRLIFSIADLTEADLLNAARKQWDDFEDALQSTTAERISADRIITRNVRNFQKSGVKAVTPSEYLLEYGLQHLYEKS